MISVEEARARILSSLPKGGCEVVALAEAQGRVLAEDISARLTRPEADLSAMDGYAVSAADLAVPRPQLRVIGESAAGHPFAGSIKRGEALRIFTGAHLPAGADTVVIQEDTQREGEDVLILDPPAPGRNVRRAGIDFTSGEVIKTAGRMLNARDIGVLAAANIPWVTVARRPRVAILCTGDELVMPGEPLGPGQIVSAGGSSLAAMIRSAGGIPEMRGIAGDDRESLVAMASGARGADILVTIGGASVGDHDLVRDALGEAGLSLDFYKIAMRPGKPLMFGALGQTPVLGLPGNPVSSYVCALLFLLPALRQIQGLPPDPPQRRAKLAAALPANDKRQDYLRATLSLDERGEWLARPAPVQDSSMLSTLAAADCLILRPPHAAAAEIGDMVEIIALEGGV